MREILSLYLEDYFEEMSTLRYWDLPRRQNGGFASLAFGAAGISYAHWYASLVLGDDRLLASAASWSRSALLAQRGSLAFLDSTAKPGSRMPSGSLLYGRAGLFFMQALVAHSRRAWATRRSAVTRFIEAGRLSLDDSAELYKGAAGCLCGAAILLQFTGDLWLLEYGNSVARYLLETLGPASRSESRRVHGWGLAHGKTGLFLALLLWSEASGAHLPSHVQDALMNLFETAFGDPRQYCPRAAHDSWLCNGFSGLTLLAARAYRTLAQPWFLEAACRAARIALADPPKGPHLCCGRAGVAFPCLALSRLDPGGPWRKHAEDLTLSTLLIDRKDWSVTGIYDGEAAIPCLALSLVSGIEIGPPCLDFIESSSLHSQPPKS